MINYPNGKKSSTIKHKSMSARGMNLEKDINDSNTYYREIDRAIIYKKPTPVQIVHVDYPNRKAAKITEAYYQVPSTTDYNGIYKGKYIDFEAKETKAKTAFPFQNIHPHQITHLKKVMEHGGIAFVIIRICEYGQTYLLEADKVVSLYENSKRQSIPFSYIEEEGHIIEEGFLPRLKFLDVVDEIYFKEEN